MVMALWRVALGVGGVETTTLGFRCANLFRLEDRARILCIYITGHLAPISIIE
jgi:hypothetical protein